jgi:hypothetical protein
MTRAESGIAKTTDNGPNWIQLVFPPTITWGGEETVAFDHCGEVRAITRTYFWE